eukprot:2540631-Rhodomonas_salina.1
MFGYSSVEHYYHHGSSVRYLPTVAVPLLCILAEVSPNPPFSLSREVSGVGEWVCRKLVPVFRCFGTWRPYSEIFSLTQKVPVVRGYPTWGVFGTWVPNSGCVWYVGTLLFTCPWYQDDYMLDIPGPPPYLPMRVLCDAR